MLAVCSVDEMRGSQFSGSVGVAPMAFCDVRVKAVRAAFNVAVRAGVEVYVAEIFIATEAWAGGSDIADGTRDADLLQGRVEIL